MSNEKSKHTTQGNRPIESMINNKPKVKIIYYLHGQEWGHIGNSATLRDHKTKFHVIKKAKCQSWHQHLGYFNGKLSD